MSRTVKPMPQLLAHGPAPAFYAYQTVFRPVGSLRYCGLPLDERGLGGVPGPILGDTRQITGPFVLYLHGGGFYLPIILRLHAALCRALAGIGAPLTAESYGADRPRPWLMRV